MSEPQKHSGKASLFGATVKGENAEPFEEQFPDVADEVTEEAQPEGLLESTKKAMPEVQAEEPTEEPEAEADVAEEDDAARLVREATEALYKQAQEQAAPAATPEVAHMEGRIQELKDQITQMGRAQQVPEPEEGFDLSVLDSPEIRAQLQAARDSDDPSAEAKALAVIAQHVYQSQGASQVDALRKELEGHKQAIEQEQRRQQNQQMFQAGLEAAKSVGDVEAALVNQFEQAHELDRWNAHLAARGSLEGYQPASLLGLWLMANPGFAATPTFMQAGTTLLAKQLAQGGNTASAASVSTTAAAAPTRSSKPTETTEEPSPEEQILQGILAVGKEKAARKKAFSSRG